MLLRKHRVLFIVSSSSGARPWRGPTHPELNCKHVYHNSKAAFVWDERQFSFFGTWKVRAQTNVFLVHQLNLRTLSDEVWIISCWISWWICVKSRSQSYLAAALLLKHDISEIFGLVLVRSPEGVITEAAEHKLSLENCKNRCHLQQQQQSLGHTRAAARRPRLKYVTAELQKNSFTDV